MCISATIFTLDKPTTDNHFLEWYPSLIPDCATLLERRGFELKTAKIYIQCEKFHMQVVLVYLQPFWRNSLLKCMSQPKIVKNLPKPAILWVQGHSRSSMLTFLKSSTPVLAMISSMSVPTCNHFHLRRAYSGKITSF